MKKLILLLLPFFLTQALFAQGIHYEKTFQTALAKAASQNKLVFLQIYVPHATVNKFVSGLDDEEVIKKYNNSFINYQSAFTDSVADKFRRKYQISFFPAYLFLDKNSNVLYREDKNDMLAKRYLDMADAALKQASAGNNLSDYDSQYKKGKINAAFLKEYITKREKLGIYDNAKLIDEYVNFLPISALNDYQTVLFILKAGPYAYGKTFTLLNTNRPLYDSIYKVEPPADRSDINNRIINNTYREAVNTKNAALAQQAANYSRNIRMARDYKQATITSTKLLLQYYLAVKDTTHYLQQASYFYDTYYMNISADSVKKIEQARRTADAHRFDSEKKHISADSMKILMAKSGTKNTVIKQIFAAPRPAFDVANELNNAAYSFYTTRTVNPNYLSKAIIWSRRAISLNPIFAYYDTLAHLLYRYGFYAEAETDQNIAVDLAKKNAPDQAERMKQELEKIKKKTL